MPFAMEPVPLDSKDAKKVTLAVAAVGLAVGLTSFFSKPRTKQGKQLKEAGEVYGLGMGILAFAFDAAEEFISNRKDPEHVG